MPSPFGERIDVTTADWLPPGNQHFEILFLATNRFRQITHNYVAG
jgi:hypothetical protein